MTVTLIMKFGVGEITGQGLTVFLWRESLYGQKGGRYLVCAHLVIFFSK